MKRYIFISTEGFTHQPETTGSEPDIDNMQVIGFGQGDTAKDALRQLLELNEYLVNTSFDEIIAIQLANDNREYFYLSDIITKHRAAR